MKRLSVFVSGGGTNLQRIAEYFAESNNIVIDNVICNNPKAYAIQRAKNLNIPCRVITRDEFNSIELSRYLQERSIDLIVLAGFLWKIPDHLLQAFPNRIVNIHPALLPKYGGKGFYGERVHKAVVEAREKESGITIHYVNENYDEGTVIFQARVPLVEDETPESLAAKIHQLEYEHFPVIIHELLKI